MRRLVLLALLLLVSCDNDFDQYDSTSRFKPICLDGIEYWLYQRCEGCSESQMIVPRYSAETKDLVLCRDTYSRKPDTEKRF